MAEAPLSIQDMMNAALRKAQMQHLQLELEVRFKKNMEVFREVAKPIYEQFIEYEPQELRLSFDADGYLNLVNYNLDNRPVYAENPVAFCEKQFSDFCRAPTLSTIKFGKSKILNEEHHHPRLVNSLIDEFAPLREHLHYSTDVPIGFMLVTGCGLGYHIERIVNQLDVHNLCIFDPHKDSFYASLHTIDWAPILQKLCQPGRMLKFFIGVEPKDAMADMKLLSDKIGLFNLVYTYLYRHFSSKQEEEFTQLYRKEFHLAASGTGFFDDEQISLAHTVNNINNGCKFFRQGNSKKALPAAFVIGNGPSLDMHIEYIRQHRENAIIFSCGTAISSLFKVGIKPDFHVEMERNSVTASWIETGTPEEFRRDVSLLCLNTIAPQVVPLFGDACLAVKPNDVGQHVVDGEFPNSGLYPLLLCNPTVTNAGLSFALFMGFKEVYLFGVDLGIREDGAHHSSLSLYYDLEKKTQKKGFSSFERKAGDYEIPGNFGDKVTTNPILHGTKTNMEILIRHLKRSDWEFNIYNPNRGALIDGTITVAQQDLPAPQSEVPKQTAIESIKQNHFCQLPPRTIDETYFREKYLKPFLDLRPKLTMSKKLETFEDLRAEMLRIFTLVRDIRKTSPVTCMLLRGSVNSLFTLITQALQFVDDKYIFQDYVQRARKSYMEMINSAYEMMETKPLQNDTSVDTVAVQLKQP
jgi:hypothetical protein